MSSPFTDPGVARNAMDRIQAACGVSISEAWFEGVANPEQALVNLERWLSATTSPALHLELLTQQPEVAILLMLILGASQPIAESLIQNPELASIVLDRGELAIVPDRRAIEDQGRILLSDSTSYSHALDRLRFLKQRWTLPIVVNDLARTWPEPLVWRALSDLADAIVDLARDTVWEDQKRSKGFDGDCPILVVGFGKLGGSELNYSSDIDLVYVFRDGGEDIRMSRVCEALTRALSDRMGRGQLYRVDLRLRPFGGTGPVACSMSSIETYYELYAEAWEIQALLRSRPIAGPPELAARWESMRLKHCFRATLASEALEEALGMRARTEMGAAQDDIKRGSGGIRDVEFLTQILQMVHGHDKPDLQVRATLDAIHGLESNSILDHAVAFSLCAGYVFLRQVEHRLQFAGDQQTHMLPKTTGALERLASLMGLPSWAELQSKLALHRRTIGSLYQSTLHPQSEISTERAQVGEALGSLAQAGLQWFDVLPECDAFYSSLILNRDSLDRVRAVLKFAPRLVPYFKASVPLTEQLLSGEIEEDFNGRPALDQLPIDAKPKLVADTYTTCWAHTCAKWVLTGTGYLGDQLADLSDGLICHCARRLYSEFDIVALGSYALRDLTLDSDTDVILFVSSSGHQLDAEQHAQFLLGLLSQLKRLGAPIDLDLRLRPEGGKGLLVRTYEGFSHYELNDMEMWERFALGQSRLLMGSDEALRLVRKAAYAQPLTPERLQELLAMKKRIETERVQPQYMRRDIKLGLGGLSDIEWFVHLHEMRYPTATKAGEHLRMEDRIRALGRARLINAIEVEELLHARKHLLTLRLRMGLQGLRKDVLPENPDKLARLAQASGFREGNELLAEHERIIEMVRVIYREGLERLKA